MLQVQIKATNIELTDAIRDYVEKKLAGVEKFNKRNSADANCYVEVGKESMHHNNGEVFKAEVNFTAGDVAHFVVSTQSDLYAAVDDMKDELVRTLTSEKDRNETMFRRGARSVKKMLKGLSSRNPFTSKY